MIAHGRIKNGVVVLDDGTRLAEGQEVTVHVPTQAREHSLLDVAPVSLASVLQPVTPDADLLGEMLEGRS